MQAISFRLLADWTASQQTQLIALKANVDNLLVALRDAQAHVTRERQVLASALAALDSAMAIVGPRKVIAVNDAQYAVGLAQASLQAAEQQLAATDSMVKAAQAQYQALYAISPQAIADRQAAEEAARRKAEEERLAAEAAKQAEIRRQQMIVDLERIALEKKARQASTAKVVAVVGGLAVVGLFVLWRR